MTVAYPHLYSELHYKANPSVIFRCVSGSRAYGTHNSESDTDIRGIFALPADAYLTLTPPSEHLANETSDIVYYSLRRFIELVASANPNFLELLFMPDDCILDCTPIGRQLLEARSLFVTQQAYESHVAYAMAQIKRSRGQNKWVNNPKPEAPPTPEQFCWIVSRDSAQWNNSTPPFRPVSLHDSGIDLAVCHAAALEHCPGVYRLYQIGKGSRGVLRHGKIVCESIALAAETSCIGLLIYNKDAYESETKDHTHYWLWRNSRNHSRWLSQERGDMDYDAKNLMHTFRLLISAEHIFHEGFPLVRFEEENLQFLLDIRSGKYSYDELVELADARLSDLDKLREKSSLPTKPDPIAVESLLHDLTRQWSKSRYA